LTVVVPVLGEVLLLEEHPERESAAAAATAITPIRSFRFDLRDIFDPSLSGGAGLETHQADTVARCATPFLGDFIIYVK
jgi:hypothetical protein